MAGTSGYLATKSWNPYSVRNQRALFEAKEKERLQDVVEAGYTI